jgi:hypothetical protein
MSRTTLFVLVCVVGLALNGICGEAQRVALVIGNSHYGGDALLRNPVNDANAVEAALKDLGFAVIKKSDVNLSQMEDAVVTFRRSITPGSLSLFYYAGHGIQVKGENYLVPIGAQMREEFEVKRQCLELGQLIDAMAESEGRLKVIVLDCCRDNPFKRSWSRGSNLRGLAAMSGVPDGTVIAFSTSPEKTASDGQGANSPYTQKLVAALRNRPANGLELRQMFVDASRAVKRETGQVPWLNMEASLEDYYLWRGDGTPVPPRISPSDRVPDDMVPDPTAPIASSAPNTEKAKSQRKKATDSSDDDPPHMEKTKTKTKRSDIPTPAPTAPQAPDEQPVSGDLAGSSWRVTDSDGENYEFHFREDGELHYQAGRGLHVTGTWKLVGSAIELKTNAGFAVMNGTVSNKTMTGTGTSRNGQSWKWQATAK